MSAWRRIRIGAAASARIQAVAVDDRQRVARARRADRWPGGGLVVRDAGSKKRHVRERGAGARPGARRLGTRFSSARAAPVLLVEASHGARAGAPRRRAASAAHSHRVDRPPPSTRRATSASAAARLDSVSQSGRGEVGRDSRRKILVTAAIVRSGAAARPAAPTRLPVASSQVAANQLTLRGLGARRMPSGCATSWPTRGAQAAPAAWSTRCGRSSTAPMRAPARSKRPWCGRGGRQPQRSARATRNASRRRRASQRLRDELAAAERRAPPPP